MNHKERHAFLLENGICTTCGKEMAAKGHTSCLSCLEQFKIIYEKRREKCQLYDQQNRESYYARNREKYRRNRELGLCVICGNPSDGFSRCIRCRKKENDRERVRKHERKQSNDRQRAI